MKERFPDLINSNIEALYYYENRAIQFLQFGWSWPGNYKEFEWGVETEFISPENEKYHSVYIVKKGNNYLKQWFLNNKEKKFVTSIPCDRMKKYLDFHNIQYKLIDSKFTESYRLIESFYENKKSNRSNQFYMNHIDEGLYILNLLGANDITKDAWCLHPIFQSDENLISSFNKIQLNCDFKTIILALEYRNIANNHLPKHSFKIPNLSILNEVNQLLVADKIQNCKDFEFYLENRTDVNFIRLKSYFYNEWFQALEISESFYKNIKEEILFKTGKLNENFNSRTM